MRDAAEGDYRDALVFKSDRIELIESQKGLSILTLILLCSLALFCRYPLLTLFLLSLLMSCIVIVSVINVASLTLDINL